MTRIILYNNNDKREKQSNKGDKCKLTNVAIHRKEVGLEVKAENSAHSCIKCATDFNKPPAVLFTSSLQGVACILRDFLKLKSTTRDFSLKPDILFTSSGTV